MQGKLLRPLSAKLLPPTEAELKGWVDREALLRIEGRGRKEQIQLAASKGINDYPCPAGGCLLTSKEFSARLIDHLQYHPDSLTAEDVALLKLGRHFRIEGQKSIIGRNERENMQLKGRSYMLPSLIEPMNIPGPVCLSQATDAVSLLVAAGIVARYSDHGGEKVQMRIRKGLFEELLLVQPYGPEALNDWRIGAD